MGNLLLFSSAAPDLEQVGRNKIQKSHKNSLHSSLHSRQVGRLELLQEGQIEMKEKIMK